jgi:hypothetical protein
MKSPFLACTALASLLIGCQGPPEPPAVATPPAAQSAPWDAFRDAFIERYFELNPSFAVIQGRHELDGQIGDWSALGLARRVEFLRQAVADAETFDAAR